MKINLPMCWLALLLASVALPAYAQYGKSPNPSDPRTPAPAAKIESAFPAYQQYREQQIRPWKESNQEVADNPGMGAMNGMAGHSMPGMDSIGAAAGHDMSSMPGMPGMNSKPRAPLKANSGGMAGHDMGSMQSMPGMASKADVASKPHGADAHDHATGSMQGMPGMKSSSSTAPKTDMGPMSNMPGMASKSDNASSGPVTGTGIVKGVDRTNGRIRLTHEPIEAKGWPRMTLFFRLKDRALADRVKEGDRVDFSLEQSASGYVISELQKTRKDFR